MAPFDDELSDDTEFPPFRTPLKISPKEGLEGLLGGLRLPPGLYELEPPGRPGLYELEPPGLPGLYELELEPPGLYELELEPPGLYELEPPAGLYELEPPGRYEPEL